MGLYIIPQGGSFSISFSQSQISRCQGLQSMATRKSVRSSMSLEAPHLSCNGGYPIAGWFIVEKPIKDIEMDDNQG